MDIVCLFIYYKYPVKPEYLFLMSTYKIVSKLKLLQNVFLNTLVIYVINTILVHSKMHEDIQIIKTFSIQEFLKNKFCSISFQ